MKTQDCIFCKIVSGDISSYKIHEDENHLAFLDISQFSEGHTLCIPKEHIEVIWDSPDIASYFEFVKEVGDHFLKSGFRFVDTLTMGRAVPHAHVHLIPHNGDSQDWEWALEKIAQYQEDTNRRITEQEAEDVLEKLRF